MDTVVHPKVAVTLRAPRVAVAYRAGSDWIRTARWLIGSLSGFWGGSGAVLLPVGEDGAANEAILHVLRGYDPDVVVAYTPTVEEIADGDLSTRKRLVELNKWPGESESATWDRISRERTRGESWDALAAQINVWCSPMKESGQDAFEFSEYDIRLFPTRGESAGYFAEIPVVPEERIIDLDLSSTDPRIALLVETRTGSLRKHTLKGTALATLRIDESDLNGLLQFAITGDASLTSWDLHARYLEAHDVPVTEPPPFALTAEEYLQRTPFARTEQWLARVSRQRVGPHPNVCVIGDTADDHALAMVCDRLLGGGCWIPPSLLEDDGLGTSVRVAINHLPYVSARRESQTLITSVSLPQDALQELVSDVTARASVVWIDGEEREGPRVRVVSPEDIPTGDAGTFLGDPEWFHLEQTRPAREDDETVTLQAPLELQQPEAAAHLHGNLHWYIDVRLPGHLTPARGALSRGALVDTQGSSIPDTLARASRAGTTYCSGNMGFRVMGGAPYTQLAHPLLTFPSAEQIFRQLILACDGTVERSDAGRRAANAQALWGSFDVMVADLQGSVRALLDGFLPPKGIRNGDYERGYAIRGDGFLAFSDAKKALGTDDPDTRKTLDRLLGLSVLCRGLLLKCERCLSYAFYPIQLVGPTFTCNLCSRENPLTHERWYKADFEPVWYYSLDQVVGDLLRQHGDLPLLAAHQIRGRSSDFLWSPELRLRRGEDEVEIDICVILDGRIIVGEAKSNGRLDDKRKTARQAAEGLVRAAQWLTADEIVLATSSSKWADSATSAFEHAFQDFWTSRPKPQTRILTDVGA